MARVAIAGFQHETNSFGIGRAGLAEFEMADSWPGLLCGQQVLSGTQGMNLPIAGFAKAARAQNAELVPILWCAAEPSGPVTDDAFDTIGTRLCDGLAGAGTLDGLYLDLHGAMITDSHLDGEGALLARLRELFGPDLPIVISLDMHANVTQQMVDLADAICIFRTYPHLDMAETGARAWRRLRAILDGQRPARAFRQADFLIPLPAQSTDTAPAKELYAGLVDDSDHLVEMALGFTAGDMPDCGPSVVSHAATQAEANAHADAALARLRAVEHAFETALASPDEAVAQAMAHKGRGPVVLADVQDNPGAGASSDTTGLARALLASGAQGAILGLMHDPALAANAHAAGVGATINGAMGGRSGISRDIPLKGTFLVEHLSDGQVRYTGEMYGGGVATLGPSCVLRIMETSADLRVVVCSIRNQCLDRAHFTHFGLKPEATRIVCVKSSAHFRADFAPIADQIIAVAAPGAFPCRMTDVPFRHLRAGVRI